MKEGAARSAAIAAVVLMRDASFIRLSSCVCFLTDSALAVCVLIHSALAVWEHNIAMLVTAVSA